MEFFPTHSIFKDLLKQFGFALKQFHICLCLFGHKKVLFGGLKEGKSGVKLMSGGRWEARGKGGLIL